MTTDLIKPSDSIYSVNIPDVTNFSAEFIYNYYTRDERISFPQPGMNDFIYKFPRQVNLIWDLPEQKTSKFYLNTDAEDFTGPKGVFVNFNFDEEFDNNSKNLLTDEILSEDEDFSPQYISEYFSDITSVTQGAADISLYSDLIQTNKVSIHKKQKEQIQEILKLSQNNSKEFKDKLKELSEVYDALSDFPSDILGLNVYDAGALSDDREFFKNLASSLLINFKIHRLAIPDFFSEDPAITNFKIFDQLKKSYEESKKIGSSGDPKVFAFKTFDEQYIKNKVGNALANQEFTKPPLFRGYIIKKYRKDADGLVFIGQIQIDNPRKNYYTDTQVQYGKTYLYTISVIVRLELLGKIEDDNDPKTDDYDKLSVDLASRPSTVSVDCIEMTPPPPPADINFLFDYYARNLIIHWDFPVNTQGDITQFQVFRRKSIQEPFQLIAQYGFDQTIEGEGDQKYLTGEVVDVNNYDNMSPELKPLAIRAEDIYGEGRNYPVYRHTDTDFVVDTEFFESTTFIYSLCSVDAHGMISNYSTQYEVKFDPFRNKIIVRAICDEGSPRSYPNMNLKIDAFKDAINVFGDQTKHIDVYFSPEYFKVQDELGSKQFDVVQSVPSPLDDNSFYLLQMINLDNQKVQSVKLKIAKLPEEKKQEQQDKQDKEQGGNNNNQPPPLPPPDPNSPPPPPQPGDLGGGLIKNFTPIDKTKIFGPNFKDIGKKF